ncbi:MAG: hypothetical protein FWE40_09025 [Oscillospiraceae bacterium]|nr:hypothetical protein [Oscillospiraceae bacterium]
MKNLFCIVLAALLLIGFALPAVAADAVQPNAVVQLIATYNRTHNGTGALVATITGPREVTITGHVKNVREALVLNENHRGITVRFNATMIGWYDANPPGGGLTGTFLVLDQRQAGKIYVDGGRYVTAVGSAFEMAGQLSQLTVVDGEILGTIHATNRLSILGGTVAISAISLTALHASIAHISQAANLLTTPYVTIWADQEFMNFTVSENRTLWTRYEPVLMLQAGQTLTIEPDRKLSLLNSRIVLHGGTLITDGALELLEGGELDIVHGIITGENAGELYGTYYADGAQCHTYCALCDADDAPPSTTLLQRVMDFGWRLSSWIQATFPGWLSSLLHIIAVPFQIVILATTIPLSLFIEWIRR